MTVPNSSPYFGMDKVGTKQDLINSYLYEDAVFWYVSAIHAETGFRFEGCHFRVELGQSYVLSNNRFKLPIKEPLSVYNIVDAFNDAQRFGFIPVTVGKYIFFTNN